jgi:hypothetical protein
MSFIYPRLISISRPTVPAETNTPGLQPIAEFTPADQTSVATGLPASIQFDRGGGPPPGQLPGDARKAGQYRILIPLSAIGGPPAILDRDFVTDDSGLRYQIASAYWNSLGWNLKADRLEV